MSRADNAHNVFPEGLEPSTSEKKVSHFIQTYGCRGHSGQSHIGEGRQAVPSIIMIPSFCAIICNSTTAGVVAAGTGKTKRGWERIVGAEFAEIARFDGEPRKPHPIDIRDRKKL